MRKKILIVDDAKFMQKITSEMLSAQYDTVCVSSGEEALAAMDTVRPDMLLTDLLMPGMTGLELLHALRERYRDRTPPVMFMTADEREENESRGLEDGAMDYIRKPFNREILLRRVSNILRNVDRINGLRMVAETDPMTGLLNKGSIQNAMTDLCAREKGTLMMVDLDSFKLVNDLYGHGMGDRILIRFAEILRSVVRSSDVVGRLGGDEFIMFCKDIRDEQVIREKVERINAEIVAAARELMGEDMNIPLGASVGAVSVPEEGTVFSELFQKADKALYTVKQNGKHGCAFFRGAGVPEEEEAQRELAGGIQSARVILEERNRQRGAYELSFENFRTVYRYLARAAENYHTIAELLLITLRGVKEPQAAADRFGEVLGNTLRRSDVYTRSGRNQFLVLLSQMGDADDSGILRRLREHWASLPESAGVETVIESARIGT